MKIKRYQIKAELSPKYSIALLTDLYGKRESHVLEVMKNNNPDIIAINGDYIDKAVCENRIALKFRETVLMLHIHFSLGSQTICWMKKA